MREVRVLILPPPDTRPRIPMCSGRRWTRDRRILLKSLWPKIATNDKSREKILDTWLEPFAALSALTAVMAVLFHTIVACCMHTPSSLNN
jgi:hypothetical protein